jgi:hypothetical protein
MAALEIRGDRQWRMNQQHPDVNVESFEFVQCEALVDQPA